LISQLVLKLHYCPPKELKALLQLLLDGSVRRQMEVIKPSVFEVSLAVGARSGKKVRVQILASSSFCPLHYYDGCDSRRLALRIEEINFI
jgi:hypothetical protein